MKARTKLIIALVVTAIVAVYGVELGTRVATGSGRQEYLIAVVVVLVLLAGLDVVFYNARKRESEAS